MQNQKKARSQGFNLTSKQLKNWKVKYHKLIMGNHHMIYLWMIKRLVLKKWVNSLEKNI